MYEVIVEENAAFELKKYITGIKTNCRGLVNRFKEDLDNRIEIL